MLKSVLACFLCIYIIKPCQNQKKGRKKRKEKNIAKPNNNRSRKCEQSFKRSTRTKKINKKKESKRKKVKRAALPILFLSFYYSTVYRNKVEPNTVNNTKLPKPNK